uniref:Reverse transcriptase Ty1/copia-type domain-containing protein n=1 Tax=Tanacetum cinerariifolium TaxID=118510 RepID=A0A699GMZ6_TANCI|nr:hypothetical protein [Tanacetum cinerariifolium]
METIHVKFDELTAMAFEHDCLEPKLQRFNNHNSSAELMNTPSKEDLDNLFGLMFEEYFRKKSSNTLINSVAQLTQLHEDLPSTSSINIEEHEAPPIETTSDEQTSPIFLTKADELHQEDSADFDGNSQFVSYNPTSYKAIESYLMALEPSNVPNFHQVQPSTHSWTKYYPLDQVIGDPSKPVMTRQRLHKDSEVCMSARAYHSWIESIGPLKEEVYVIQPKGFIDPEFPNHVYRLKNALYGLKQAPRAWYDKLHSFLIEHGFTKGIVDLTLFTRRQGGDILLVQKHGMDECVLMSTPMATERLDADLQGTPVNQTTYRQMIGGLMYLTTSRLVIAYATFDVKMIVIGTSGGLQFLGGKLVCWSSKKQDCTAMCTAEAEYVSLSACFAQVIWMRTQLFEYGYKYNRILMYCDSKSTIAISRNPVQHSKTKHIDIQYHFIKEHVKKGTVELYFVGTEYQLADTKTLLKERFEYLVHRIGFWHTLKEYGSKYRLKFMLDGKELSLILDDFRTIFHLPQATNNNHDSFVLPPSFSDMIPFYKKHLGFTMELKTPLSFKTTGLLQPVKCSNTINCDSSSYSSRSIRLTPPALVPTVDKAGELILQDTLQVSLAEHKSRQEQEARENVALVEGHLASVEIEKMVEGQENVVADSSIPRNAEHNILDTRLEPMSDKEILEVEFTDVVIPVNVNDEEDEITDEELQGRYGYLIEHPRAKFMPMKSFVTRFDHLHQEMAESLHTMVDRHIKEQVQQQVSEQIQNKVLVYVTEGLIMEWQTNKEEMEKMIANAIL